MKILIAIEDIDVGRGMISLLQDCVSATTAEIKAATVIPSILAYSSLAAVPSLAQELRDESRERAVSLLHDFTGELRTAFPQASVDEALIEGNPAHEILALAEKWHPDLIVVGSHGYRGVRKIILGSVSQAIVAQARCTVLVSRKELAAESDATEKAAETASSRTGAKTVSRG